jgi:hypothetical protein
MDVERSFQQTSPFNYAVLDDFFTESAFASLRNGLLAHWGWSYLSWEAHEIYIRNFENAVLQGVISGLRESLPSILDKRDCVATLGGDLLADEVTCIQTRSLVVSPFAMAMGMTTIGADGQFSKEAIAADRIVKRIATRAHSVTAGVILNNQGGTAPNLRPLSQRETFRLLLTQHLDLGTDLGECLTTLADLSLEVPFVELTYAGYPQIEHAVMQLASFPSTGARRFGPWWPTKRSRTASTSTRETPWSGATCANGCYGSLLTLIVWPRIWTSWTGAKT